MPARVVVVFREATFADETAAALIEAGYEAVAMSDSMQALDVLEGATTVELLITSANFYPSQPNGQSLARMTKLRRPSIKVIFANGPEIAPYVDGDGTFIPTPVTPAQVVEAARQMLSAPA